MIRVTVYKNQGIYKGITVSGHSGYAAAGEDVVCAAVSALVINTVNSLERFTDESVQAESNEAEGVISIKFNKAPGRDGKLLMDSLIAGLEDVKKGSEDYIAISYKEG